MNSDLRANDDDLHRITDAYMHVADMLREIAYSQIPAPRYWNERRYYSWLWLLDRADYMLDPKDPITDPVILKDALIEICIALIDACPKRHSYIAAADEIMRQFQLSITCRAPAP